MGDWVNPVTNTVSSFTYVHGDAAARITWLWKPIGYKLATSFEGGNESVTVSVEPNLTGNDGSYYSAGASVVVTAHGYNGCRQFVFTLARRCAGRIPK